MAIRVNSEIKTLKKVLLHRPGAEFLNLTPDTLERLLFDDIPYLKVAQEEHDMFARTLTDNGVEVVYLEDLVTETLNLSKEIKEEFLNQFIEEAGVKNKVFKKHLFNFLNDFEDTKEMVLKTMGGINIDEIEEIDIDEKHSLAEYINDDSKFLADPMPNLVFTRDNFASVGSGISLNRMYSDTRNRETIYAHFIFKYHPEYKDTKKYFDRTNPYHTEGGDLLVLNDKTIAMGISQRTQSEAIEILAKNLFVDKDNNFERILAFKIPSSRAFMHLDTVFTQIDYDKFTYHPGIMETLEVFEITYSDDNINVLKMEDSLENILEKYLEKDIKLIPCGGGDKIIAEREQWNDGSNTLSISPGVVIVYDRNVITNFVLRSYGIKVLEIHGAELSRGRGGPRCMSMPLEREE